MLQLAQQVLQKGKMRYPRRRIGVVYDCREFEVDFPSMEQVDFWACSGMSLPFRSNKFGLTTCGRRVLKAFVRWGLLEAPTVRAMLNHIGEPSAAAPISPCRGPPHWEMFDQTVEIHASDPEPEYHFDQSVSW